MPEPKNPPVVTVTSHLVNDGITIEIDDEFFDAEGNHVKLVTLKFFLADLTLSAASGAQEALSPIELFDHRPIDDAITTPQWPNSYAYDVPAGSYEEVGFGVGVPGDLNGLDPADYDNDHPLSLYTNMYWAWATMYRFIIVEAKMDTTGGNNFDHDIIFHTGLDTLYRGGLSFERVFSVDSTEQVDIRIDVDWNALFYTGSEPIDVRSENTTHTADSPEDLDLARRFTDNFISAIEVR